LRLETNRALEEAIELYRAAGFREVAPFNDEPYAHYWFEKTLSEKRWSGPGKVAKSCPDNGAPVVQKG
jgi:hypothetical protein